MNNEYFPYTQGHKALMMRMADTRCITEGIVFKIIMCNIQYILSEQSQWKWSELIVFCITALTTSSLLTVLTISHSSETFFYTKVEYFK